MEAIKLALTLEGVGHNWNGDGWKIVAIMNGGRTAATLIGEKLRLPVKELDPHNGGPTLINDEPHKFLIIDDGCTTGRTANQAIERLRMQYPNAEIVFAVPAVYTHIADTISCTVITTNFETNPDISLNTNYPGFGNES